MKHNKRKCFKCGSTSADPDVVLHRFPNPGLRNIHRCELWAKYVFPNGPWSSKEFQLKLYSEHRMLCQKHFKKSSYIDLAQKKLNRQAVPDEDCDEVEFVAVEQIPGPSSAVLKDITNSPGPAKANTTQSTEFHAQIPGPSRMQDIDQVPEVTKSLNKKGKAKATTIKSTENHPQIPGPSPKQNIDDAPKVTKPLNKKHDTKSLHSEKYRHYYIKSRKYLKKICQLRNTLKKYKHKDTLRILAEDVCIKKLQKKISPTFALLLQGQIKNFCRNPKGRRWNDDDKVIALRIYKKSPTCYRLLRRMFSLPAPSTLKRLLSLFNMPPGINQNVLNTLKKYAKKQRPSDNEYVLMFDEMAIKKHILYNKKTDSIEGFQDHGNHGRTCQEAVKALVFMVASIRKPVKEPLAYYLSGANVTADRLTVIIKEIVRECFNAGLNVAATVCDMGGTNRKALHTLGATEERPVMTINNRDIIALFDAPHLLKCFRNMFLKYNIKCKTDISSSGTHGQGLAKWSDIQEFYEVDSRNPNFVFAPSLKKEHLEPNTRQKMKVNLAAQVLSHTVACGMFSKVSEGKLHSGAVVTANVLSKMDKLFDLVNSDSPDLRRGKPHATNISDTSPHLQYFQEMISFFKDIEFVGCPRPPPSLEGWVWTMRGIIKLWEKMKKYPDVKSLATRRLQQDPLENLFGCIRGNCGSNANPTTAAFVGGIKTAIISNLAHISSGNCETDDNLSIVDNFKNLLIPSTPICTEERDSPEELIDTEIESYSKEDLTEDSGEIQACAYVCGFLIKNHKILKKCNVCKNIMQANEATFLHNFVECKEYYNAKTCLNYAKKELVECVEKCALFINSVLNEDASRKQLRQLIEKNVPNNFFNFLNICAHHREVNKKYIKCSVFYICINRYCTLKNRSYAEEASRTALRKKIDILKNK